MPFQNQAFMRKTSLIFALLFSLISFSQSITVNTTTHTDLELVRDVLVNSPCVDVRNVSSRTGTNFGSTNGIGYFTNTNPAFPLQNGVVLTTGNVLNSPGPNSSELSDGSPAWLGDAQLEAALLAAGITMNSTNATVLEFDFTSFSSFMNFQFLFASEEYGTYQCNSPDAFAFLITDQFGVTQNLAVIPSTTTPISVETIRNFLYNSACPSSNAQYFGSFNGGSAAAGSATNYNGQTVLMDATKSDLIPGDTYHIKLVIADRGDQRFDSAVFLGGGSFDFNSDVLGPDVADLCNNNGVNENYTISSGLDPNFFDFIWKDANGNPIPGETGPDLVVNQPGTYFLTYFIQSSNCEVATNDIIIGYQSGITVPDPVDLYKCNSGLTSYTYDLAYNTPIVDPSSQYVVSYHEFQLDAENNAAPLPLNYNVTAGSLPKQIWIRIQNTTTGCYTLKSFNLRLTPAPVANNPGDMTECEITSGSNTALFNLPSQTPDVLLTQSSSIYSVTYHLTQADANSGANPIDTSSSLLSGNATIYVRIITITDPNCFNTTSFNLIVKPKPLLDPVVDQYVCVEYILPTPTNPGTYYSGPNQGLPILPPGTHITVNTTIYLYHETGGTPSCPSEISFRVVIVDIDDITPAPGPSCDVYNLPAYPHIGTHYYQFPGGPSNPTNVELLPGHAITALGTTTIYTYFTYTDPTCMPINSQFDVVINRTPTINNTFANIFDCTQVNSLPTINTDVGTANYYTFDSGTGTYTPVTFPITTTTELHAYAENNGCRSTIYTFTVYIGSLNLQNVDLCVPPYTLTAPPVGEYRDQANGGGNVIATPVDITQTTTIHHYVPGAGCTDDDAFTITFHQPVLTPQQDAVACDSFLLPTNPDGGRYFRGQNGPGNGLTELFANVDSITTTETIWIYKESATPLSPVCYNEIPWNIIINQRPVIDSRDNQIPCYFYNLTPLANGAYFDDPLGVNPITDFFIDASDLNAGDDIPGRIKTIYIYAENPNDPNCYSQNSFDIIFDGIEAHDLGPQTHCDSFTLPPLPVNNFYYDASHLGGGGNLIAAGTTYNSTNIVTPIYIYTETNNRFSCVDENSFTITINDTPVLDPPVQSTVNVCNDYTLPVLNVGKYYTMSGGPLVVGNVEIPALTNYTTTQPIIYAYAETGTTPNCFIEQAITITIYNVTELLDVPPTCESYQLNPNDLGPGENYYDSNGVLLAQNAIITTPGANTILIRGTSTFVPSCTDESDFIVNIVDTPVANSVVYPDPTQNPYIVCDTYNNNDGIYRFNLTLVEPQVLGTQAPASDFVFSYFTSSTDADLDTNSIPNPLAYENDNPLFDSFWVRISNRNSTNPCYAKTEVRLVVNLLPEPHVGAEYFICEDYETGTLLNSAFIDTGLSTSNYTFVWTLDGNPYGGNTSSITTNQVGNYSVLITNNITRCFVTATTKVTKYSPYIEYDYSDAFENPTYITVNVLGAGSGNYEYQLDNGPFQDSNVFYDVTPGEHTITVRDKNGHCSPAPVEAVIINYPKFFTPNGDGYHETWNIPNLIATNPNAPIHIFDRLGKLIKQITPSTNGWNGTYNGQPLPATDYWFTVDYNEKGSSKVFKSHFSLKR